MKKILPYLAVIVGLAIGGCNENREIREKTGEGKTPVVKHVETREKVIPATPQQSEDFQKYLSRGEETEQVLAGLEGKTAMEIQDMVLKYKIVPPNFKGNAEFRTQIDDARIKMMEIDLNLIQGVYDGTVQVRRGSDGGYHAEGEVLGLDKQSLENMMRSRLRARMNADINGDYKITLEELKDLKSYLFHKKAR